MSEKSVSVLVTNYNSFDAIQLCVESVRKFTARPHKIIVYNDNCINGVDDAYLHECRDRGWIELYEDPDRQLTHGGALNKLINEVCDTDYAAVLDCDTQVRAAGWLDDLIECAESGPDVLGVADMRHERISVYGYYVPGFYQMWFSLLNMAAYRDGMMVDWRHEWQTRDHEPYVDMFRCLDGIPRPDGFDDNKVDVDPGSKLWVKVKYDNPKRYRMMHLPEKARKKFYHYGHISYISIPNPTHSQEVQNSRVLRMGAIGEELRRLRCQS